MTRYQTGGACSSPALVPASISASSSAVARRRASGAEQQTALDEAVVVARQHTLRFHRQPGGSTSADRTSLSGAPSSSSASVEVSRRCGTISDRVAGSASSRS